MKTSKFFFSTLIAAAAMSANAYAEIDSFYGTLEWTTAPTTGGNFWGGDYELTFNFTEEVIKTLDADKYYVLAAYWGSNSNNPDSNALLLNYSTSEDKWTLQLGRGELANGGYGSAITSDTTYTFSNSVTFNEAIVAGRTYTLSVTGGNQAMTPTLSWGDSSTETLSSYAGNMNGGNGNTTMNYGLLTLYYVPDSDYVWGGGENGSWSDSYWTTSSETENATLPLGSSHPKVVFDSSVEMVTTESVSLGKLTVANEVTLTIQGGLEKISALEASGTGTIKGAFGDGWGNKFDIGAGFAGTLNVTGGKFTINTSSIGSGSYVLESGVDFQVTASATVANNISFKGEHEFHTNGQNVLTLSGVVSGESSSVVTKLGGGTLYITGNSNEFAGTLQVAAGTVYVGLNNGDNPAQIANLTNSPNGAKVVVEQGAKFYTHVGNNTFNGDIYVKSGAALGNKDGNVSLAGDVHWGVTNSGADVSTPTYSADSSVNYTQYWGKTITFAGKLYGDGTVNLGQSSVETNANYIISGVDNSFAGTYSLSAQEGKSTTLKLSTETAASAASVNLTTAQTSLKLGASAVTIAGLSGTGSVALDGVSSSTLTVNGGGEFAGTFANGVTLNKTGEGTLTLSGNNTTYAVSAAAAGSTLKLSSGADATISGGDQAFAGSLDIGEGSIASVTSQEVLSYNDQINQTITLNGGTLEIAGGTRQTVGSGTKFVFNGGTISQSGDTINGGSEYGALDIMKDHIEDNAIKVTADTTFSASLRVRGNLEFNVSEGMTLTMSGVIDPKGDTGKGLNDGAISKFGYGTMIVSGANSSYNGGFTISQGKLVAKHRDALGSGDVTVESGATLSLGTDVTVKNLSGAGLVELDRNSVEGASLTVESTKETSFTGQLTAGNTVDKLSLIKTGREKFSIVGDNNLVDSLEIREGILATSGAGALVAKEAYYGQGVKPNVSIHNEAKLEVFVSKGTLLIGDLNLESGAKIVANLEGVELSGESTITLNIVAATAINMNWSPESIATLSDPNLNDYVSIEGNEELLKNYVKTWAYNGEFLSLTLAIPEPSLFGLLAGLGALTLVGTRRRRAKKD